MHSTHGGGFREGTDVGCSQAVAEGNAKEAVRPKESNGIGEVHEEEDVICGPCEGPERCVGVLKLPELPSDTDVH